MAFLTQLALFLAVAALLAVEAQPVRSGATMIDALTKQYKAVKTDSQDLLKQLSEDQQAGKLTPVQTADSERDLNSDINKADSINSDLLVAVGSCWGFIQYAFALDACLVGAAVKVTPSVNQLVGLHHVHQQAALKLINGA